MNHDAARMQFVKSEADDLEGVLHRLLIADLYEDFQQEADDPTNKIIASQAIASAIRSLSKIISFEKIDVIKIGIRG